MWEANRHSWSELRAAGSAAGVPEAIENLRTAKTEDEARRYAVLVEYPVVSQGALFQAAVPTSTCLMQALASCSDVARPHILEVLFQLGNGFPDQSELALGNDQLPALCRREIARGASLIFATLESAPLESIDYWTDVLMVIAEEGKDMEERVEWHLRKLLQVRVDQLGAGFVEYIERWLAGER
jgi:hypothetical protein